METRAFVVREQKRVRHANAVGFAKQLKQTKMQKKKIVLNVMKNYGMKVREARRVYREVK